MDAVFWFKPSCCSTCLRMSKKKALFPFCMLSPLRIAFFPFCGEAHAGRYDTKEESGEAANEQASVTPGDLPVQGQPCKSLEMSQLKGT